MKKVTVKAKSYTGKLRITPSKLERLEETFYDSDFINLCTHGE